MFKVGAVLLVANRIFNGIYFSKDEIKKAVKSFEGVPIVLDHSKRIEDVVGKVISPSFDEKDGKLRATLVFEEDLPKTDIALKWIAKQKSENKIPNVSVGVWLDVVKTEVDGKEVFAATNIEADHVAMVIHGACSDKAGCGIGLSVLNFERLFNSEFKFYEIEEVSVMSEDLMELEKWTVAYINSLPDSAFAAIEPAYKRGETEDKRARHLPHHDKDGKVDLPHLRNAFARLNQIEPITDSISKSDLIEMARKHLEQHRDLLDKAKEEESKPEEAGVTMDTTDATSVSSPIVNITESFEEKEKRCKEKMEAIMKELDELRSQRKELEALVAKYSAELEEYKKRVAALEAKVEQPVEPPKPTSSDVPAPDPVEVEANRLLDIIRKMKK